MEGGLRVPPAHLLAGALDPSGIEPASIPALVVLSIDTPGRPPYPRSRKEPPDMPKQEKVRANIRILPVKGVSQTINYLLEDRDELDWLVAVGKNKNGEIFFYDTGGDILEDLGTLEYLKQRIIRAHFGDDPD
jgi:hypothetical protein